MAAWAWATGARPRFVCSRTPVALITGVSRRPSPASARARAEPASPAAIASRAASTSRAWGSPTSAQAAGDGVDRGRPRAGGPRSPLRPSGLTSRPDPGPWHETLPGVTDGGDRSRSVRPPAGAGPSPTMTARGRPARPAARGGAARRAGGDHQGRLRPSARSKTVGAAGAGQPDRRLAGQAPGPRRVAACPARGGRRAGADRQPARRRAPARRRRPAALPRLRHRRRRRPAPAPTGAPPAAADARRPLRPPRRDRGRHRIVERPHPWPWPSTARIVDVESATSTAPTRRRGPTARPVLPGPRSPRPRCPGPS